MAQNKEMNDADIVSVLGCLKENLSEAESSGSDNEIGNNQVSDSRSGISVSEQCDG